MLTGTNLNLFQQGSALERVLIVCFQMIELKYQDLIFLLDLKLSPLPKTSYSKLQQQMNLQS